MLGALSYLMYLFVLFSVFYKKLWETLKLMLRS